MNSSRSLKIIFSGSAAIVLMLTLRIISGYDKPHEPTPVWKAFNIQSNDFSRAQPGLVFLSDPANHQPTTNEPTPQPITQIVRFDPRGETEFAMMAKMTEELRSLGLEKDERTVSQLVFARVSADWCKEPESWRKAPEWAELQSMKLKRKIAWLLASNDVPADELTIERIYLAPIGPEPPPVKDWSIAVK